MEAINPEEENFQKLYSSIFNEAWYPKKFVNPNYSIFICRSNLEDFTSPLYSFMTLIKKMSNFFEDKNIYFKSFAVLPLKDDFEIYYSSNSCEFLNLNEKELLDIFFSLSEFNTDEGFLIFGENTKWAFYYGEDLFEGKLTGNFEEFGMFIIHQEFNQLFIANMQVIFANKFNLINMKESFYFNVKNNRELYEIKLK